MFIVSGAVSLLTFKNWAGLSPSNPVGIFVVTYLLNAIFLFVYVVCQIILVVGTLEDRWPLGDIAFGVFFFVIGQVILYVFSESICDNVQHYLDGLFFATICNLLAVMMVYKVSQICETVLTSVMLTRQISTGIQSLARTSSFQLASRRITGKSRNFFQTRTSAALSTKTLNMPRPCISNLTTTEPRTTQLWDTKFIQHFHSHCFSRHLWAFLSQAWDGVRGVL